MHLLVKAGLHSVWLGDGLKGVSELQSVNAMIAEEFLRVTQNTDLDAAMDAALSSLQPAQR